MEQDVLLFFNRMPGALPLYEAVEGAVKAIAADAGIKVHKTQITFFDKYGFAFVSLPLRRVKGMPEVCLIVTFGLNHRVQHPRIFQSVEPYPNRWTHHVIIERPGEVDGQLTTWLREAHGFARSK